ncbi:signal peptidase I, partial [Rhodococcus sp. BP-283]|nr:signal peptidase I [Rhodococcus sp. BP-283]
MADNADMSDTSAPDTSDAGRRFADRTLTVAAVLGALCIVFAVCASVFSLTPLVFRSGSMEPSIPTGSLALARETPAVEVQVGDVVSVLRSDGSRITHRVDRVDFAEGETAVLILKGDANSTPDADPYILSTVDRVVAHVPYAGYAASWLSTPFAWVVGGLAAAALLYVVVRPTSLRRETSSGRELPAPAGRHRVHSGVATVLVAVVVIPGFAATQRTEAALQDTARASAVPAAATLLPPASLRCDNVNSNSVRLTFPKRSSPGPVFDYQLSVAGMTPTALQPSTTDPVVYELTRGFLGGLLTVGSRTVDVRTTLGSWISPTFVRQTVNYSLLSGLTCAANGSVATSSSGAATSFGAARVAPTSAAPDTTTAASSATATTSAAPTTTTTAPPVTSTTTTTVAPAPTTTPPVTTTTAPPPPPPTSTTPS